MDLKEYLFPFFLCIVNDTVVVPFFLAFTVIEEVFYLATKGGGEFFGKVGSFEEGYEFDAVVLNNSTIPTPLKLSPKDRLERLIYLSDDRNITAKYVAGRKIL